MGATLPRGARGVEREDLAAIVKVSNWRELTVQVGVRRTSENGVTFPVGKSLPAGGKADPI